MKGLAAELRDAAYTYTNGTMMGPWTLGVAPGERVLVAGPSGGGKTSLLRVLSGLAARAGEGVVAGEVLVAGHAPERLVPAERPRALGWVGQEPLDQLIAGTLTEEVAFGLRCAGRRGEVLAGQAREALVLAGLSALSERDPRALSGGQQQRLVVAAALAPGGRLLLLDEPLAHLDGVSARGLLALLAERAASGVAVVMVEHRLDLCLAWASRLVLVARGEVVWDGPAERAPLALLAELGLQLPRARALAGREVVAGPAASVLRDAAVLRLDGLHVQRGAVRVLSGVSAAVQAGERVALLGANGAGKSSLLQAIGERRAGVWAGGKLAAVPQDPDLALVTGSVWEELAEAALAAGREVEAVLPPLLKALRLEALVARPPQSLSRGQRLRVAVGAALATGAELLLLDEPTAGQDFAAVQALFEQLSLLGAAVVFATHDLDVALGAADRVWLLEGGALALDLPLEAALPGLAQAEGLAVPAWWGWATAQGWTLRAALAQVEGR